VGELADAFATALRLLAERDPVLVEIVGLSLRVSLGALACACALGLPLGAALGALRFPGRNALRILVNALLGLPPVVVGLLVYLLLSRAGPLGALGLLFTPPAMVLAQALLVTPIIVALTAAAVETLAEEYGDQLRSLGAGPWRALPTLLLEGRAQLSVAVLAGLGRALGEVGAVILVGGNIAHATRVMTTAIALETSRGALALALALGLLLVGLSILLNGSAYALRQATLRHA
jgi:tungstate transport system permease protein